MYFSPRTSRRLKHVQRLLNCLDSQAEPQALQVQDAPAPRQQVIVFTGSFNPPTSAHLAMLKAALQFAQRHGKMSVYAAFSKLTVDKEHVERPLLVERVLLLEKILRRRLPHAGILLFNRGLYVEQAEAIQTSFPHVKRVFFLIGFDKVVQILDPHYYTDRDAALEELFRRAELLVAPRGHDGLRELEALLQEPQNQDFARYIHHLSLSAVYRDISSTQVRQGEASALKSVPQEVREFMRETRAYAPPLRRQDGSEIDYYGEHVKELEALLGQLQS